MSNTYVITRVSVVTRSSNPDTILAPGRVYVTGPHHFGGPPVWSSSDTLDGATRYTLAEANAALQQCPSWQDPRIEQPE